MDIDEMRPVAAKGYPGRHPVCAVSGTQDGGARWRAKREADDGRRGNGYVFGASQAARGEAFTDCYGRRTTVNFVDFLAQVDG